MLKTRNGDVVGDGALRIQRIIRRAELPAVTGYSIPHIYELISEGQFPRPVPLGRRAVGWLENEIAEWQAGRIKARASTKVEA